MIFRDEVIDIIKKYNYKKIVEVGVWEGELSKQIAELDIDELYLVDPWMAEKNAFIHNGELYLCTMGEDFKNQKELDKMYQSVVDLNLPKTKVMRNTSEDAALAFKNESLDFVFIDAIHTYEHCKADIAAWLPKIKAGGMLAGDDYDDNNGVAKAVDEIAPQKGDSRVWKISLLK